MHLYYCQNLDCPNVFRHCLSTAHDTRAHQFIFVLFPLQLVPVSSDIQGSEIHRRRALADYPVRPEELPKGLIMFDSIEIAYPK